jgi:peptidoglycan/xylan/chitin deacetylase (PgdA/CDA1 family)
MEQAVFTRACSGLAQHLALKPSGLRRIALALPLSLAGWLAGCGSTPQTPAPTATTAAEQVPAEPSPAAPSGAMEGARGSLVGQNASVAIYVPVAGDTLQGVAARVLGDADRAWRIAEANGQNWTPAAGAPLVVPLGKGSPLGISGDSYQTVPILCYHRFGSGTSKMLVAPAQFEAQLEWLARHHYKVLRLRDLAGFLAGREPLPQRSVVITIDDGYDSVYRHAYPALKKHGFSATLFVYTDFVGARDGLSWAQLQEMAASGAIDIQAHSKSHRNLIERSAGETEAAYRQSIETEVRQPRQVLERRLAAAGVQVRHFAFPFGDANELVLESMERNEYSLGVTVNPGGNAFFAQPQMLRRTMIFGDHDLEDFKARLQTRRSFARP